MTYTPYNRIKNIVQLHGFNVDVNLDHPNKEEFKELMKLNPSFNVLNERYPHIASKLLDFCGNPAFDDFTIDLLNDTRGGARQGFPDDIGVALMRINRYHDELMQNIE